MLHLQNIIRDKMYIYIVINTDRNVPLCVSDDNVQGFVLFE